MQRLAWLIRRMGSAKRIYSALAMFLVVGALAATLYGLSQGRQRGGSSNAAASDATTTATTLPTAESSQPPLSGPTPTAPTGGHPVVPSNGSDPFTVQAVTVLDPCGLLRGACDTHTGCPLANPFQILGAVSFPKNAPDGYFTYRWRLSDGTVTAPAVAHYSWDDKYGQDNPVYNYLPDPAIADGRSFSLQLEVMKPNPMISLPSNHINIVCETWIKGVNVYPHSANLRIYDCIAGGAQTFSYTASVDMASSPSFTINYYWKHPDGSVTPTQAVTTTGGATSVALQGDSITLTAPNPPPPAGQSPIAYYTDTLVVIDPPSDVNVSAYPQYQAAGLLVAMPNCSNYTPTPTATTASIPTATP